MDPVRKTVEAALFISGRWMTPEDLSRVVGTGSIGLVKESVKSLMDEYNSRDGGIRMAENDGRYRMEITQEIRDKVYYLAPEPELSPALIKTLALIAYKQPITQGKVVDVIGNRAYEYIKELRKKEFISVKIKGRSKILTTTGRFRKYFGLEEGKPFKPEMGLESKILEDAQKKLAEVIPESDEMDNSNESELAEAREDTKKNDLIIEDKKSKDEK